MARMALILLLFAASGCAAKEPSVSSNSPGHSPPMPAPRDGQAAVQEEFDAAEQAGTPAAWDLFIRRHPDNALTPRARAARAALANQP
jgi:hypothetical protein